MPTSNALPSRTTDRAYDILRSERSPLEPLFQPRSVAVIGASERQGSVGRTLLWNLLGHPSRPKERCKRENRGAGQGNTCWANRNKR